MLVGGIAGLVGSALANGPWWFYLLFLGLVSYIGCGLCYHRAYLLRVHDGVLSWSGFRYHGSRVNGQETGRFEQAGVIVSSWLLEARTLPSGLKATE